MIGKRDKFWGADVALEAGAEVTTGGGLLHTIQAACSDRKLVLTDMCVCSKPCHNKRINLVKWRHQCLEQICADSL